MSELRAERETAVSELRERERESCKRAERETKERALRERELKGGGVTSTLSEAVLYCVHRREKQPLGCFDSRNF